MGKYERDKGARGEREVRTIFQTAGYDVRAFQRSKHGEGDTLAMRNGRTFYVETKLQERVQWPVWNRQARESAPQGTVPLVVWRQSRGEWYVTLKLSEFLES